MHNFTTSIYSPGIGGVSYFDMRLLDPFTKIFCPTHKFLLKTSRVFVYDLQNFSPGPTFALQTSRVGPLTV